MIKPFRDIIDQITTNFRQLEKQVPPPERIKFKDGFKVRYQEKNLQQALLLKFARYISGLHAIDLLLSQGYCQEVGIIQPVYPLHACSQPRGIFPVI